MNPGPALFPLLDDDTKICWAQTRLQCRNPPNPPCSFLRSPLSFVLASSIERVEPTSWVGGGGASSLWCRAVRLIASLLQGSAKEWSLGCVKCAPAARGGQDAGITQPGEHSLADPCERDHSTPLRRIVKKCARKSQLARTQQKAEWVDKEGH